MREPIKVANVLPQNNEKGFSAVEVILVAVIVALIGTVGWLVYKNHHKTTTLNASTTSSKATTKSTIGNNTKTVVTANPYAGWQSFCSSQGGLCLKYPSNWTLAKDIGEDTVTSPSGNIVVSYWPTGTPGGPGSPTQETINVQSVTPTASSNYEVVGLAYTDNTLSTPSYGVNLFVTSMANAAYSSGYSASNGDTKYTTGDTITSSEAPNYYLFSNPVSGESQYSEELDVTGNTASSTDSFSSLSAAEAWLNTSEVKTATQILASVSTN